MTSYDPREMASDALRGARPPAHSGLKDFVTPEGVHALAAALEDAVGTKSQDEKIESLKKERDDLQSDVDDLEDKLKKSQGDLRAASAKITEALECLQ